MTVKGCRSFAGMVIFLSTFCPELQKLLKCYRQFSAKSFVPTDAMLKKSIPINQNLKDENLDNLNSVLCILSVPIDCHVRFECDIRGKLLR